MGLSIVILAAGKGTRMRSALPKVLQPLAGTPLLQHVLNTCQQLDPEAIYPVIGFAAEQVRQACHASHVNWVEQKEQLGTGHAVLQALPTIPDDHTVLILYGDVPRVRRETMQMLVDAAADESLALLSVSLDDPTGYGRVVRDDDQQLQAVVEQKDANSEQLNIQEVNTGLMAAPAGKLKKWLSKIGNDNSQGEYYLTDVVALAAAERLPVICVQADNSIEVNGVNDRSQLVAMERTLQLEQANALLDDGVLILDPARFDLRGSLNCGDDVVIDINAVFEGTVQLESGVKIGPNCIIKDAVLGENVEVLANTVIDGVQVGANSRIGPFARLRPGAKLADDTHVGNFVEIKKSIVGKGSKINHLSYVGDAQIGEHVNIGAGTITCNYDGVNKHQTIIDNDAFIGSNSSLVAPIRIGKGATIGAGSTLSQDAPEEKLTVSRSKQRSVSGWKRPEKKGSS